MILGVLVGILRFRGFDANGYTEAETLLTEVFDLSLSTDNMPDLVVVDLDLAVNKMKGMELISVLAERNVTSEIPGITGNLTSEDLVEAIKIGATAGVTKPFDYFSLVKKMETLAETGRKRRVYRA